MSLLTLAHFLTGLFWALGLGCLWAAIVLIITQALDDADRMIGQ